MTTELVATQEEIPVILKVAGVVCEPESMNRLTRKAFEHNAKKFRKKYSHLRGVKDDQGRTATIVLHHKKRGDLTLEVSIVYPEDLSSLIKGSENATRIE